MSGWCWVVKQVAWQPGYGASAHEPGATSSTSEEHSLAQDRPCVVLYAWTRVSDLSARTWHPMSLNHADWPRRRHGERVPRCTPGLNHRRVAGSRANSETLRGNARKPRIAACLQFVSNDRWISDGDGARVFPVQRAARAFETAMVTSRDWMVNLERDL